MMLFIQVRMLGWVILSEGVQVDFFVNGNLSWVEFCLFRKKYVNFTLLPKSVAALRIGVLSIFLGAGTKVSPRVSRDVSAVERW